MPYLVTSISQATVISCHLADHSIVADGEESYNNLLNSATAFGEVRTFGRGSNGQLGHGNLDSLGTPTEIFGLGNITAAAAGRVHSILIDGIEFC